MSFTEELSKLFMGNAEFGKEPNWVDPFLAVSNGFLLLRLPLLSPWLPCGGAPYLGFLWKGDSLRSVWVLESEKCGVGIQSEVS